MSADNYIGVYPNADKTEWYVTDGSASCEEEDCMYRGSIVSSHSTEDEAASAALKRYQQECIVEYGVISLGPILKEPCGYCYVCIHNRNVIAEDIERCDYCKEPFHSSSWRVMKQGETFHRTCEWKREEELKETM